MKFRKSCDLCNVTFFTPNRNALYCAKCAKKMGVPDPTSFTPASKPAGKPTFADAGRGPRVRGGPGPHAEVVAAKPRGPVLVKKNKKGPRPPKPTELTSEIRDKISQLFRDKSEEFKDSTRALHAEIAEKAWVRRWMVAEVIQDLTAKEVRLTPDQRLVAAEMYRDMVEAHDRPQGGRRKTIATKLNVPAKEVILAVREWARRQEAESPTPRLSRQQLFEIEKTYWNEMDAERYPLADFPARIAESLGFANRWQVLRWIDVLHDDPHSFDNVPDPEPELRQAILDAYADYLKAEDPPEKGLHQTIAEQVGPSVKPRQVHKVLQTYRHDRRANYAHKE